MSGAVPRAVVAAAAATLPRMTRQRYREQWAADLRDADEANLSRWSIALGAVVFAATADRTRVRRVRVVRPEVVIRRTRTALALAYGGVGVTAAYIAGATRGGSLTTDGFSDFLRFFGAALVEGYSAVAPVAAIVIAFATPGISARTRIAVTLLLVSIVPVRWAWVIENSAQSAGLGAAVSFLAAALLVAAAVVVHRPAAVRWRRPEPGAVGDDGVGGLRVLGVALAAAAAVGVGVLNLLVWLPHDVQPVAPDEVANALAPGAVETMTAVTLAWAAVVLGAAAVVASRTRGTTPVLALVAAAAVANAVLATKFSVWFSGTMAVGHYGWSSSVPGMLGLIALIVLTHLRADREPREAPTTSSAPLGTAI